MVVLIEKSPGIFRTFLCIQLFLMLTLSPKMSPMSRLFFISRTAMFIVKEESLCKEYKSSATLQYVAQKDEILLVNFDATATSVLISKTMRKHLSTLICNLPWTI